MNTIRRWSLILSFLFVPAIPAALASPPRTPQPAPDFTLPTASGKTSLHDLRGKVVLVDFWASWCAPCRESFPWMGDMLRKYRSQGLAVVAINLDKDRDKANAFLFDNHAPFVVAFDPSGDIAREFHVEAMPQSFIVSRSGAIVYAHEGFFPKQEAEVEKRIEEALSK